MRDYGDEAAEKAIKELNKKIQEVYGEAERDLQEKMDDFVRKYKVKEKKYLEQLEAGSITQADFDAWKQGQIFQGRQWRTKQRSIADVLHRSNEVSTRMINDMALGVCAENVNWASYTIEQGFGINFGFNIYDETTVANLIKKEPDVLPKWKIDQHKDYVWNKKKLNNAVTQGIIQGEKLDEIAKRVADGLCGSNKNLMKTFATTAMTGAQNAGRDISYKNAKKLGINLKKEWVATLDMRTRSSHRKLDGQKAEIDEPFKSEFGDIMFPGDPTANAADVYNCRCTMIADLVDYPAEEYERYDNIDGKPIKGMSYKEWAEAKKNKEDITVTRKQNAEKEKSQVITAVVHTEEYNHLKAWAKHENIEHREVIEIEPLSTEEIIEKLSGGDMTGGSCASLTFAYCANRNGLDVTDYRGGASRSMIARNCKDVLKTAKADVKLHELKRESKECAEIIKGIPEDKEFVLITGKHASVIRKDKTKGLQYLELQARNQKENGWVDFENVEATLRQRFGCRKTPGRTIGGIKYDVKYKTYLADVDSFEMTDEFKDIMGYINTAVDKQVKGALGGRK